ncbi:adenine-specific DNA methylase [Rhodococcus sp. OK611]|uniref:DUF1156 domain-containing protein n=1 Tax=unclassified Rhodococcus (in: high G+C Gram-positive bacteria) TaxID=192944 RepID=UPI000BCF7E80|nr:MULTISPECIES: DUF1156 domain-containing protein [unclassified Rhodococcus (in: high G+C Gram-positive bacteria)]PTR36691.1 adenine-specific DNA methylase [Rhodococcus sp. OK611]SNX93785.1 Adenine-specific DNA methylase, contains a Zn-ribbon domain [Rhodococcus sp. OK270]
MTRMIERWFPCAEVSAAAAGGWGSGNLERKLFTWFAARPSAQARAAMICSLLPWPTDESEQEKLQDLVRRAMTGREAAWSEVREEIVRSNQPPVRMLDPFSGRGMIPLEAARLGIESAAIDYSPVAVLASSLLIEHPFEDWSNEPRLPFSESDSLAFETDRLAQDVDALLAEIGRRQRLKMQELYPTGADGSQPWGYLWAVTLPCQECGRRFPLIGKNLLREPAKRRVKGSKSTFGDPGQAFYVESSDDKDSFHVVVHDGPPSSSPTLVNAIGVDGKKIPGKSAICVFCGHVHPLKVHRRMTNDGLGRDSLLLVADHDPIVGKRFRIPTEFELNAVKAAKNKLENEGAFSPFLPAIPGELIGPGNNNIIGPSIYGARTFGDFMCDRQTLYYVRLCKSIDGIGKELADAGISNRYVKALTGYAAANMVRMLRYSTRGAWLHTAGTPRIAGIFLNEGSLSFSYDFFESGIGDGPGTWDGVRGSSVGTLRDLLPSHLGNPANVSRGTATELPYDSNEYSAVVTDPPYDEMIAYGDSSDIFYVWLRRALVNSWPELSISSEAGGAQEKALEIIVKRSRGLSKGDYVEHRTREHYDRLMSKSFSEMRRVVRDDGVVTIVFGHGDPVVWQRLLTSIESAGLIMTGSWPANTESGGRQGKANIETTLTMACRPAPADRRPGRKGAVEAEIQAEIKRRYPDWERWGLAPADMLMAAAGPAMEVVGRYSEVLDATGEAVGIHTFLPLARSAVQAAMAVEVDHHPLETFDARTRFALWWVRLYGRQAQAKSELRWQALASSLDIDYIRDLVPEADKGVRFATARSFTSSRVTDESAVIDVALALAAASEDGIASMGEVLANSGRSADDAYLWAAVKFLADRLPDSDPDAVAFTRVLRTRAGIANAADAVVIESEVKVRKQKIDDDQLRLL